jgi:hypothetical protein
MYSILENLREDDYFSLIQFSTNVMVSLLWHTVHVYWNTRWLST